MIPKELQKKIEEDFGEKLGKALALAIFGDNDIEVTINGEVAIKLTNKEVKEMFKDLKG